MAVMFKIKVKYVAITYNFTCYQAMVTDKSSSIKRSCLRNVVHGLISLKNISESLQEGNSQSFPVLKYRIRPKD